MLISLITEWGAFLKSDNDNDIENIESLKLKLNVTDPIPVCKPYRKIPTQIPRWKNTSRISFTNKWMKTFYSSYAISMVCARKKDGTMRLCIVSRELNKKGHPNRLSKPRIKTFMTISVVKNISQRLICWKRSTSIIWTKNSRKLTAFTTPWGWCEWLRIRFGFSNAPPDFQRFMNECLSGLRDSIRHHTWTIFFVTGNLLANVYTVWGQFSDD